MSVTSLILSLKANAKAGYMATCSLVSVRPILRDPQIKDSFTSSCSYLFSYCACAMCLSQPLSPLSGSRLSCSVERTLWQRTAYVIRIRIVVYVSGPRIAVRTNRPIAYHSAATKVTTIMIRLHLNYMIALNFMCDTDSSHYVMYYIALYFAC